MLSKAEIMIEGEETKKFKRYIRGKIIDDEEEDSCGEEDPEENEEDEDEDSDEDHLLKYESPFVKRMILPQEPRLFCLLFNGNMVAYDTNDDDLMVSPSPVTL